MQRHQTIMIKLSPITATRHLCLPLTTIHFCTHIQTVKNIQKTLKTKVTKCKKPYDWTHKRFLVYLQLIKRKLKKVNECCWQKLNPLCPRWIAHQQTPGRQQQISVTSLYCLSNIFSNQSFGPAVRAQIMRSDRFIFAYNGLKFSGLQ